MLCQDTELTSTADPFFTTLVWGRPRLVKAQKLLSEE